MRRSHAFLLIVALFVFAGAGAYFITGKPQLVGEIGGKVLSVTTLSSETDAKAEVLVELDDGRRIRLTVGRDPRPEVGARLLLLEYRAEKRDIHSFQIREILAAN